MPDCKDCPSYIAAEDTAARFKKDLGAPACGRYEQMLAKPGMLESVAVRVRTSKADSCPGFGLRGPAAGAPGVRMWMADAFTVTTPDPAVIARGQRQDGVHPQGGIHPQGPTTCAGCEFYVEPQAVKEELGWGHGICAATGRLLLAGSLAREARDCSWGRVGSPRDTTVGLIEHPIYSEGFSIHVAQKSGGFDPNAAIIDPQVYPTDREVTADEKDQGIRAWRTVRNPDDPNLFTELPIFEVSIFDEDEARKIPMTGDEDHPEWYVDHDGLVYRIAAAWMGLDETPVLWGHAGVGKTELLKHLEWIMCLPFERVSVTEEMELDDLAGAVNYTPDKGTFWVDGVVPRRWERPGVICFDEPNTAQPAVWQFLRPMTDNAKQLVVNDQVRSRHPFCFFGMAMNPAWAPQYVGTRDLSSADTSRTAHIWVSLPDEATERSIILRKCETNNPPYEPAQDTVEKIMLIARDIRNMVEDGSLPFAWNIREQAKVLRLTQFFPLLDAYRMAIADGIEPQTAELILGVVKTYA